MAQKVFLVHGWSVTDTTTYRGLHHALARAGYALQSIYLGRYVSLDDELEIRDLARGLEQALVEQLGNPPWEGPFHIHKNRIDSSYLTAFIDVKPLDRRHTYFLEYRGDTGSSLTGFEPEVFRVELTTEQLDGMLVPDQTTQIEIVFRRKSESDIFRFHSGNDPDLHVKWDREGKITGTEL